MAIGQIVTLLTGASALVKTQSQEESQAVAVLNPNDGVVYLKINAPSGITAPSWDWKLPSQSYGVFPGPWLSLGLTYVDQSGSGRNGEINVYDADAKIIIPIINAIGRAVQQAGTSMDITQGGKPANPPASTGRLWIDANGDAWILYSDGSQIHLLDSNDQFVGDIVGPYNNNIFRYPAILPRMVQFNSTKGGAVVSPTTGKGVEIQANPTGDGTNYIASYDRDGSGYLPLHVDSNKLILTSQGNPLDLNAGYPASGVNPGIFQGPNLLRIQTPPGVPTGSAGVGLEIFQNAGIGYVQSWDRTAGTYAPIALFGSSVTFQNGTINNAALAGPINALLGKFEQVPGAWSWTPGWFESPMTVTCTFTGPGFPVRVEYSIGLYVNTAGAIVAVGLGRDGSIDYVVAQENHQVVGANAMRTYSGTMYYSGGLSGSHRIGLFVNVNAGALLVSTSQMATLYVTEQRK
jgi:hypothetical protein